SIAEIAAVKKASILVPLATAANDEQRMNAYEVAENGGALVLEEQNLGEHILASRIFELYADSELRKKMSERITRFYHADAATVIAQGIIRMLS
ncbi:MAG: glycosyltransferase, partial [Candidatus Moraniibacteriota bacterium]